MREETPDATATFQNGLFDATALQVLQEKSHPWLQRTHMLERLIQKDRHRESDSDLTEHETSLAGCGGSSREKKRSPPRAALPKDAGVLPVDAGQSEKIDNLQPPSSKHTL